MLWLYLSYWPTFPILSRCVSDHSALHACPARFLRSLLPFLAGYRLGTHGAAPARPSAHLLPGGRVLTSAVRQRGQGPAGQAQPTDITAPALDITAAGPSTTGTARAPARPAQRPRSPVSTTPAPRNAPVPVRLRPCSCNDFHYSTSYPSMLSMSRHSYALCCLSLQDIERPWRLLAAPRRPPALPSGPGDIKEVRKTCPAARFMIIT